ncbi:DEAD/DEAH box helicase [Bartonella sp. DGB2]|uniref:DEAD/DEAH box helicase n=1 Tax=Bartonella sp. DGB2 TaxID=3388426 RepID=UPI00398FC854
MNRTVRTITSRLSLRQPQTQSLEILANVVEQIELSKECDLAHSLKAIQALYPSVQDFERDFPSLCFALATGVGKTRLMGAFISYLYLTGRSRHFFVLAPNLTIYEKLIQDFGPRSPKYVFKGIQEFITNPPVIITGEDYADGKGVRVDAPHFRGQGRLLESGDTPFINIFNISKINATENKKGAVKTNTPRIKRLQETIGESYFNYLANLPDLVMLMDEAHRYRASAGAAAINELKPILGIELTATPKTTGAKSVDFKNIIYGYSLAQAMNDGFVKEPAVATRKDFDSKNYTEDELERIKLEDGIHHHEHVKVELDVYARQYDQKLVKPFILVVAQDTKHARQLRELLESDSFFEGRYKGKVAEVHSKQSGAEEDENIQRLMSVEDPDEPTEIVIHVNKLKEGWDVTNLYTIVPLRASASEILTEQTIGRGLRLPYGRRTGVEAIDRLTIIAHDRFQEIVDKANDPNSIIKKHIEIGDGGDVPREKSQIITVPSFASGPLVGSAASENDYPSQPSTVPQSIFNTPQQRQIAEIAIKVVNRYEHLNTSRELSAPEIQSQIIKEISEQIKPAQESLNLEPDETSAVVKDVVETVTKNIVEFTIDIPNVVVIPSRDTTYSFRDFDLTGLERLNYQPVSDEILIRQLRTNNSSLLSFDGGYDREEQLENYITRGMVDHDLVDYDEHCVLLNKLAGQIIERFKSYLSNEKDVENVLIHNQKSITEFIITQLKAHYWETSTDYQVNVTRGFTILKPLNYTIVEGSTPRDFRYIPEKKSDVKKIVFGGFKKCCYPLQKFDSVDGELRFAQILENDEQVLLWVKPPLGVPLIEYKNGLKYEPDFVVETIDTKYLCEIKMASQMQDDTVLAKQKAAILWCERATQHAKDNNGKPWYYILIPHDMITANKSFMGLVNSYKIDSPTC